MTASRSRLQRPGDCRRQHRPPAAGGAPASETRLHQEILPGTAMGHQRPKLVAHVDLGVQFGPWLRACGQVSRVDRGSCPGVLPYHIGGAGMVAVGQENSGLRPSDLAPPLPASLGHNRINAQVAAGLVDQVTVEIVAMGCGKTTAR